MSSFVAKRNPDRCPTHPGALLRQDRPVSAAVAVRLGKMSGNGPLIWIRMQAAHDAGHAVREVDVSTIPTLKVA